MVCAFLVFTVCNVGVDVKTIVVILSLATSWVKILTTEDLGYVYQSLYPIAAYGIIN